MWYVIYFNVAYVHYIGLDSSNKENDEDDGLRIMVDLDKVSFYTYSNKDDQVNEDEDQTSFNLPTIISRTYKDTDGNNSNDTISTI